MDVGIDITSIERFKNRDDKFISYILTPEEYSVYNNLSPNKKPVFLATRWACKEAIFKATEDPKFLEYSILNTSTGKPYILNYPDMKVSISHEGDTVIAIVIVK